MQKRTAIVLGLVTAVLIAAVVDARAAGAVQSGGRRERNGVTSARRSALEPERAVRGTGRTRHRAAGEENEIEFQDDP